MSTIENNVMASVRVIYAIRALTSAWAIKLYVALAALYALGRLVWVSRVFENLEQAGLNHALQFFISAVLNTQFIVQVTLAVFTMALIAFVVDALKTLRSPAFI